MVDFRTPKKRPRDSRSNALFACALLIVGLVGFAFVEGIIKPDGDRSIVSQSQLAQATR